MRKLFTILLAVLFTASVFAQSPPLMNYQAVIRDASNNLVTNQSIGMRVSIIEQYGPTPHILYEETYSPNPQTNANGLVSIAIGTGTPVTGTFPGINWTNGGIYSVKIETDPTGGTNYTIAGTSQISSVPYALHANKADKADSVEYSNITPVTAGNNIMVTGSGTTASPYIINDSIHKIGDSYGGGIVFYVYDNGRHGLIAATTDQSTNMRWYAGTNTSTMAMADGVGAGKANTAIIIANQGYGDGKTYAARICNEYSVTVNGVMYGDWYLPSKYELSILFSQKSVVGGGFLNTKSYWSSTEYSTNPYAWVQDYTQYGAFKSDVGVYVRAIRTF